MDPVMAQVMMTFDFARMEPPLSGRHTSQAARSAAITFLVWLECGKSG